MGEDTRPSKRWEEAARVIKQRQQVEKEDGQLALEKASNELGELLYGPDWKAALDIFRATGRRMVFARRIENDRATMYLLDHRGVVREVLLGDVVEWQGISAGDAVEAGMQDGGKNPNEIMSWIEKTLDELSASILENRAPVTDEHVIRNEQAWIRKGRRLGLRQAGR